MKDFMKLATAAARQAGKILREGLGKQRRIRYKGEINLVTEMDRKAEKVITKIIRARYPEHAVMVEEGEGKKGRTGYKWIIDPLDGTTNYAHGYPCFCSSIAEMQCGMALKRLPWMSKISSRLCDATKRLSILRKTSSGAP